MNEITRMMDDIFGMNDFFFNRDPMENALSTNGFRKILRRAHNLIEVKDKNGKTIAQKIEVVTTPFEKKDVRVTIKNDILTVECGSENKTGKEDEVYIYHGISSQTYKFSLSIPETIDQSKITAENSDGILSIVMPLKDMKKEEPKEIEIKIM